MKLKVNGWELTITAKRGGRACTADFLNEMSIAFFECAQRMRSIGGNALADDYQCTADDIYKHLSSKGIYDKY